jgi:hypothetical protein
MPKLRYDVYGREVLIGRERDHWSAYYIGADGKRRSATDIVMVQLIRKLFRVTCIFLITEVN